jgi:hypothetical protein
MPSEYALLNGTKQLGKIMVKTPAFEITRYAYKLVYINDIVTVDYKSVEEMQPVSV